MGQRVLKGQMELKETRVKWDQKAQEDFQEKKDNQAQRETMGCQAPGDHRGQQESLEKMAPEVTLVMLDLEENLDHLDQRETPEDLASAILGQEENRVAEEIAAAVDLAAAEETVVKRVNQETKELPESQVSQVLRVNLV